MKNAENYQEKSKKELLILLQEREKELLDQHSQIDQYKKQISFLEEYIKVQQLRQFANKSEKSATSPQLGLFNEAEPLKEKEVEQIEAAETDIQVASYQRKSPGRKPLPADLPRVQHIHDLDESEKICACGCQLTHISDEKSEQLDIIPAKIYVIEHIKKKYACKQCQETIKTARMPIQPIPKSIASSGVLSHVLVAKFQDGLPLYRQEKIFKRIGIDLPRATMCLWVIKSADLLKPLMKLMQDRIVSYDVAYADETTIQVLKEPRKGVQSKKYMWLFAGGPPEQFTYYYHYHPARSHEIPLQFFDEFKGYLHCDGFTAYDTLAAKQPTIKLAGCLYHVRRKFVEVAKLAGGKEGIATTSINYIAKLSLIEESIKQLPGYEKQQARQEKSLPILQEWHEYLLNIQSQVPPKSLLGQAISYTFNQWPKLLTYLDDGRLEISNNRSERAIKPFVIGRKGWLFADSVEGAEAAAIIYSLVETCKHHSIEPYHWFRYALQKLPNCQTVKELEALLPFNVTPEQLTIPAV